MNYKKMGQILSAILAVEAVFQLPALGISLFHGEQAAARALGFSILIHGALAGLLALLGRRSPRELSARDGMVCVALSWLVISLLGCLPFWFSGAIPGYIDALFEMVSGFTTTGASILRDVEAMPKGLLYWRSFSHWVGGMGVLVFILAVLPASGRSNGFSMHLLRAESPGPTVGKLAPRMKQTAMTLYVLYIALTVLNVIFLLLGGMSLFDAVCTAMGTAGTGGFGVRNDSIASYSPYLQNVTTVFMFLFGVNFSCYYLLLNGRVRDVLRDEELRIYLGVALSAIVLIAFNVRPLYASLGETLRHSAFQVGTIMTTTGYATTDFDLWPGFSKAILLCLMAVGACAGSTGGGLKCIRVALLFKALRRSIRKTVRPRSVQVIRMNGQVMDEAVLDNVNAYLAAYVIVFIISFVLLSLDEVSVGTNLSAVMACLNNIGPGFEAVGPTMNYADMSIVSKLVLIMDMLIGRLEIFPILLLFSRTTWKVW